MRTTPSVAERLDHAIDELVGGAPPGLSAASAGLDRGTRVLVETADHVRSALAPPPVAARFEARLGARLAGISPPSGVPWPLRHPGRLIVTGAVGSAVGVGVTAFAVWRSTRRGSTHRFPYR
jgi:hypothetical protein